MVTFEKIDMRFGLDPASLEKSTETSFIDQVS